MSYGTTLSDTRKAHLALVISMARRDGRFDKDEKEWVVIVSQVLGMSWDEIDEAQNMGPAEVVASLPESKGDRAVILQDMLICGAADGNVDPDEARWAMTTAAMLGFDEDEFNLLVSMVGTSSDDLRRAFS